MKLNDLKTQPFMQKIASCDWILMWFSYLHINLQVDIDLNSLTNRQSTEMFSWKIRGVYQFIKTTYRWIRGKGEGTRIAEDIRPVYLSFL